MFFTGGNGNRTSPPDNNSSNNSQTPLTAGMEIPNSQEILQGYTAGKNGSTPVSQSLTEKSRSNGRALASTD